MRKNGKKARNWLGMGMGEKWKYKFYKDRLFQVTGRRMQNSRINHDG